MSRETKSQLLENFNWPTEMNCSAFRMPTLDASVIRKMSKTDQEVSKTIFTEQASHLDIIKVAVLVNGMQQMELELDSLSRRGIPDDSEDVRRTYNSFVAHATTAILGASFHGWASDQRTKRLGFLHHQTVSLFISVPSSLYV